MASFAMALPSKKEEELGLSSYYNNKTTIIQEARVFNDSPISPRKCRTLLTRIVYLLYIGETFGTQEATTLFFGTTKLFQHKDVGTPSMFALSLETHVGHRARCGRLFTWQSKNWRLPLKM
jgi:coatomer protein complex subunit gamma